MPRAYAQYINVNIEDPMFHETSLDFDDDSSPSSPLSVALVVTPDSQHDSDPVDFSDCGFCFLFLHEASFDDVILPASFHDSSHVNLGPIIDSGASCHIWSVKEHLQNTALIGEIHLDLVNNEFQSFIIKDVLYSPQIGLNLISPNSLIVNNPKCHYQSDLCGLTAFVNDKPLFKADLNNHLYHLSSHVVHTNKALNLSYSCDINFWHQVLGHLNP